MKLSAIQKYIYLTLQAIPNMDNRPCNLGLGSS